MPLQKKLLRAMLALLALAAATGIMTVFVPTQFIFWRLALTMGAAALAIAFAVPATAKLDHERTRSTGLAALIAIVPAFILILVSIWIGLFAAARWEPKFAGTGAFYAASAVVFLLSLGLFRRTDGKIAGATAATAVLVSFACGIAGIWIDPPGLASRITEHLWATVWLVFSCGMIGAACLYGLEVRAAPWRWIGVLCALAGLALGLWGIWEEINQPSITFVEVLLVGTTVGACTVLNALALRGAQRWVTLATMGMILLSCFFASYLNFITKAFRFPVEDTELSARLLTASAIVSVCGLLAIAIFQAMNKRVLATQSGAVKEIRSVRLSCPRCATRNDAPVGTSRCAGCGLLFIVQVAEPRCATCDYNLLDLKGELCPECGTPISQSLALAAHSAPDSAGAHPPHRR
jgi:hypothetical protein